MIEMTLTNIDEIRRAFDPKLVKKALDRAISTAANRVRTQISVDVRQRYNIKAGDVGKSVTLRPINQDGVINRLLAYTGGRLSLRMFAAGSAAPTYSKRSGRQLPVRVTVLKAEGRKQVQGGFLAKGLNHETSTPYQIFQREGDPRRMTKGNYAGLKKQPLRKLTGPAIPTMVSNPKVITAAVDRAGEVMGTEFTRQMELLMSNTGGA